MGEDADHRGPGLVLPEVQDHADPQGGRVKQTPLTRKTPLKAKKALQATHELSPRRISRKAKQDQVAPRARKPKTPKRAWTRQKRRPPMTPEEREHLDRVAKLGCWCCEVEGRPNPRADIHHIRQEYGASQRASHWEALPTCEGHHQGMRAVVDKTKVAFHRAAKTWRLKFGSEVEVLLKVWERLGLDIEDLPRLRGSEPPWWRAYKEGRHRAPNITEGARRVLLLQEPA
jgi:hypothetical protein